MSIEDRIDAFVSEVIPDGYRLHLHLGVEGITAELVEDR